MSGVVKNLSSTYGLEMLSWDRVIGLVLIVLCLCLSACGEKETTTEVEEETVVPDVEVEGVSKADITTELKTQKEKWLSHKISNYQIEMQKLCFCPPEVVRMMIFEINENEIKTARYVDTGDTVAPENYNQDNTIEGLFAVVEQAMTNDPAEISITYDEEYGFIKSVTIDFHEKTLDDEVSFITSNMRHSP